jgi:hypothetical protein
MSTQTTMSMSSATGKQILSLIRNGDYAHAGEERAIELALEGIAPSHDRQVLDIGCGLGGTVDYISRLGLGSVTDLSRHYETWYGELVDKINSKRREIVSQHGDRWFDYALRRYQELLDLIQEGIVGGAIFRATAIL